MICALYIYTALSLHKKFSIDGEIVAQEMSTNDKNFCPLFVPWSLVPLWQLEVPKIDLKVLGIKLDNPESNLEHGFQCHIIDDNDDV